MGRPCLDLSFKLNFMFPSAMFWWDIWSFKNTCLELPNWATPGRQTESSAHARGGHTTNNYYQHYAELVAQNPNILDGANCRFQLSSTALNVSEKWDIIVAMDNMLSAPLSEVWPNA